MFPTGRWWPLANMWRVKGDTTSASLSGLFTRARRTGRPAHSQETLAEGGGRLQCLKLDRDGRDGREHNLQTLRTQALPLSSSFVGSPKKQRIFESCHMNVAMSKQHYWVGTIPRGQLVPPRTFQFVAKVKVSDRPKSETFNFSQAAALTRESLFSTSIVNCGFNWNSLPDSYWPVTITAHFLYSQRSHQIICLCPADGCFIVVTFWSWTMLKLATDPNYPCD